MSFEVGKKFYSFKDLENEIEQYTKLHNVHFYKRDGLRLHTRGVSRCKNANDDLIYYKLIYSCVYGGRKHQRKPFYRGERKSYSIRYGCKAFIKLLLSENADALEVMNLNLEHNHPNLKEVAKLHIKDSPLNRRRLKQLFNSSNTKPTKSLPLENKIPAASEEISNLSPAKTSQSTVGDVSDSEHINKMPSREKIRNPAPPERFSCSRSEEASSTSEEISNSDFVEKIHPKRKVELAFGKIREKYSCSVIRNEDLRVAFLQDDEMKKLYNTFPEVLFFNRTCTVIDVHYVCFTFLTIGTEGVAKVIALGFVAKEDKNSLDWLINSFKNNNANWWRTQIVMTEKDLVEMDFFEDKFPGAAVSVCRYSALEIFKQEATISEMQTTKGPILQAVKLLRKMCDSGNEAKYMEFYTKFLSLPSTLMKYFDKNWHPIRKDWTCISFYDNHCITSLNDQLESFNSKLSNRLGDLKCIEEFLKNYFALINVLRDEEDKTSVNPDQVNRFFTQGELEYYNLLITYAFKKVLYQLRELHTDELIEVFSSQYYFSHDGVLFRVSPDACDCIFAKAMKLPCKHIFSVRRKLNMSVFEQSLVDPRWVKPEVLNKMNSDPNSDDSMSDVGMEASSSENINSEEERFLSRKMIASELTNALAHCIAESTGEAFERKLQLIGEIMNHWKNGGGARTFTLLPQRPKSLTIPSSCTVSSPGSLEHQNIFRGIGGCNGAIGVSNNGLVNVFNLNTMPTTSTIASICKMATLAKPINSEVHHCFPNVV